MEGTALHEIIDRYSLGTHRGVPVQERRRREVWRAKPFTKSPNPAAGSGDKPSSAKRVLKSCHKLVHGLINAQCASGDAGVVATDEGKEE